MPSLTVAPRGESITFMNFPHTTDLDRLDAHVAIIGMPYGDPYSMEEVDNDQSNGPTAVRRASRRISQNLDRWDFDIGGTVFDGKPIKVVDVGDVRADPRDLRAHYQRAEEAIRKILRAGALPITIGGDHGIPIPIFRALSGHGPVTLVHVDAHLDWRDEVNGAKEGYSSTIRRASEMAHIGEIFQIGIRGQGSARAGEVEAARRHGANIITADELEDQGTGAILARIPDGGRYYLTIDADGLDPAVMPAVGAPQPGGVTYRQTIGLIKGLTRKGQLIGMDIVEIMQARDLNDITSITAGHIILNVIGAAVRAGYFS
jgi:agmatinase